MSRSEYLTSFSEFAPQWARAKEGVQTLVHLMRSDAPVLYFDSGDLSTLKWYNFVRSLLEFKGEDTFVVLVLRPDPVTYFHHHFRKYPAVVIRPEHNGQDFLNSIHADPGDSPADAIEVNSRRYAVLPVTGDWMICGDRYQEYDAMFGPPDVIEFTREHYPFNVFERNPGFSIDD